MPHPCTRLLSGIALLSALSAPALAQQQQPQGEGRPGIAGGHTAAAFVAAYDRDGDGKVTKDELFALRTERFQGADKDGDGKLNEAEYVAEFEGRLKQQYAEQGKEPDERYAGGLKQAGVRFAVLDRDRDNLLTQEEDLASAAKTFDGHDTNGDGVVSADDPPRARNRDGDGDGNGQSRGNSAN